MAIALPGELQEVTVSAMPPNQLQPIVTPPLVAPRPLRPGPSASRPASRRTIRPNLNAKRVNTVIPASENHRASECALERCLEGFAVRDGHKSMPSRELICPGGAWKADSGAR